ncbi:MAG: glycoside hydrolase family 9 protein [Ruminococcus sp.]
MKNALRKAVSIAAAAVISAGCMGTGLTAFAGQQLGQTDFENGVGLPWHVCESAPGEMDFEIKDGQYIITIVNPGGASRGGEDRWDCQFRHRGLTLVSGCTYEVAFDITASNNCTYYTKIGDMAEPFTEDWHGNPDDGSFGGYWDVKQLTANKTESVKGTFTAQRTAEVEWAFHIGGESVPEGTVFTFDNMSLVCTNSDEYDYKAPEEWNRAAIVTNQVGYFTKGEKKATWITENQKETKFSLLDEKGKEVFSDKSEPMGTDADSGDSVQVLDFSDFEKEGTYTLKAGDSVSREFTIGGTDTYSGLLYDALNYFYQNRSGIEIESKYITSGDANSLARAAGHSNDTARITTDWNDLNSNGGTQDVTGGWYDAGDHGKYVVNGGLSVWLMQNQYERAVKNGTEAAYADGTMNIPENANSYPDLLDEARWEIEWLMKMMVQSGEYEGMAYHKVHDIKWTALGLAPADDPEERILKPPTTAATLNLSAACAQAARIWQDIDKSFSEQCITAAEKAYEAAKKNPDMFAPLDQSIGGGPYGDTDVSDEFYWAACELFRTTGRECYLSDMKSSEWYLNIPTSLTKGETNGAVGSFDWGNTAALGSLSLILDPDSLGGDKSKLEKAVTSAADKYIEIEESQGYGQPYGQSKLAYNDDTVGYVWGSNSFVADNAVIIAAAYDLTEDDDYMDGVISAVDYLLGRNPVDYSYVTGYGAHAVENPHHRYWSAQAAPGFPSAPAGVLVGGPNSGMQDPWVKGSGWVKGSIAPAKCYMDNVEAWSVNECTINWNAPLAWLTAFLCEENGGIKAGAVSMATPDSEKAENTDKPSVSENASKDYVQPAGSGDGFPWKTVVILTAVLAVVISLEVFIYKLVKHSRTKKS